MDETTFAGLKQLSVIVLLLGMLGQSFSRWLVELDYQLNKAYIAKNLCVNRDRPEMKCQGRCYLCKRLKQEDKKDQESPERKTDKGNQPLFSETGAPFAIAHFVSPGLVHLRSSSDNHTLDQPSFCFHPPD